MKDTLKFNADPVHMGLMKQFHREILTSQDYETLVKVYAVIFTKSEWEVMPHEIMVMKEICRTKATEWGSGDLATPIEGITTTSFGVLQGGIQ